MATNGLPFAELPNLQKLERTVALPTLPHLFTKVSSIVARADSSIQDLRNAVEEDQAVSARVLRIANSAAFGFFSRVTALSQACSLLGMRMIRNIVLQTSLMTKYEKLRDLQAFDLDEFWQRTMLTATLCRAFGKHAKPVLKIEPDECYTAGLIHDIGILVLLDLKLESYLEVMRKVKENNIPIWEAETQTFGFDHAQIGAYLAMRWNFPELIQAAIAGHHFPEIGGRFENIQVLVCATNMIALLLGAKDPQEIMTLIDPRFFTKLMITQNQFETEVAKLAQAQELI